MAILKKRIMVTALGGLMLTSGCGSVETKTADVDRSKPSLAEDVKGQSMMNSAILESNAYNFVQIGFAKGSSELTDSARVSLNSVIKQAVQAGKINEIVLMSWADEEYPSKNRNKLSQAERTLAKNRNAAVEAYLKKLSGADLDAYNMAEQPTAFSKWFNTPDTRLKNALVSAGLPTTAHATKAEGKASQSVILIKLE